MANGDRFPLLNPRRNLGVDCLGMLWDYKIGDTVRKPQNDGAKVNTHRGSTRTDAVATGAEVTHVDLKSDITTGKQQLFPQRRHLEFRRTVGNW